MCDLREELFNESKRSPICYKVALKDEKGYFSAATGVRYEDLVPIIPPDSEKYVRPIDYFKRVAVPYNPMYIDLMHGKTAAFLQISDANYLANCMWPYVHTRNKHKAPNATDYSVVILEIQFEGGCLRGKYNCDPVLAGEKFKILGEYENV